MYNNVVPVLKTDKKYIDALHRIIDKTSINIFMSILMGANQFENPWFDFNSMENCINYADNKYKNTLKLLKLAIPCKEDIIRNEIGAEDLDLMIECGIWARENGNIESNNFSHINYQGIDLIVEVNSWFKTCKKTYTDVYIGLDSYRLAENIEFRKDTTVLDLCSGSGIQGIIAARSAKKVVSVEINEHTVPVTKFNIALNGLSDIIEVRQGDLYDVLSDDEKFDYIYANPPFIPVPDNVVYPICGGAKDFGLAVLKGIVEGAGKYLKTNGKMIIFCECLGDKDNIFFDKTLSAVGKRDHYDITRVVYGRLERTYQTKRLAGLTKLFNDSNFNEDNFINDCMDNYDKIGAKYLYSLLYHIVKRDDANGSISKIDKYLLWDADEKAKVDENLIIGVHPYAYAFWKGLAIVGSCNEEFKLIYECLKDGLTIRETADKLWPKFKDDVRYKQYGKPALLDNIQSLLSYYERIGIVAHYS